jgi:DDE superfamily endonuclease
MVMDDYGTHKVERVKSWFVRQPRYHVHFTPTSGSWLNLVERLFAEVTSDVCGAAAIQAFAHWKRPCSNILSSVIAPRNPLSGPQMPISFFARSSIFVNESPTQDTSI